MLKLDAPIVAVTVFVNRARVTRRGTITLEAGEHVLVLDTLPETLEPDSVWTSGLGITLLGVDVILTILGFTVEPGRDLKLQGIE